MSNIVKNKAFHIYCTGSGMVKNEYVKDVMKELEGFVGIYYEGVNDQGITLIERA